MVVLLLLVVVVRDRSCIRSSRCCSGGSGTTVALDSLQVQISTGLQYCKATVGATHSTISPAEYALRVLTELRCTESDLSSALLWGGGSRA